MVDCLCFVIDVLFSCVYSLVLDLFGLLYWWFCGLFGLLVACGSMMCLPGMVVGGGLLFVVLD